MVYSCSCRIGKHNVRFFYKPLHLLHGDRFIHTSLPMIYEEVKSRYSYCREKIDEIFRAPETYKLIYELDRNYKTYRAISKNIYKYFDLIIKERLSPREAYDKVIESIRKRIRANQLRTLTIRGRVNGFFKALGLHQLKPNTFKAWKLEKNDNEYGYNIRYKIYVVFAIEKIDNIYIREYNLAHLLVLVKYPWDRYIHSCYCFTDQLMDNTISKNILDYLGYILWMQLRRKKLFFIIKFIRKLPETPRYNHVINRIRIGELKPVDDSSRKIADEMLKEILW